MPFLYNLKGFPWWLSNKESTFDAAVMAQVQSLGWDNPLEKEMATHPSILAWEIPWAEELGRLQSMVLQKCWT